MLAWLFVAVAIPFLAEPAEAPVQLLYKPPQNMSYLVIQDMTRTKRHETNRKEREQDRCVVRYGVTEDQQYGLPVAHGEEFFAQSISKSLRRGRSTLHHALPGTKMYPCGQPVSTPDFNVEWCGLSGVFDLLPVLPEIPVSVGDTWVSTVEFRVANERGLRFPIAVRSTFERIEEVSARRCAVVGFAFAASVRPADYPERTGSGPYEYADAVYTCKAEGQVAIEAETGLIVRKSQHYEWTEKWTKQVPEDLRRGRYYDDLQDLLYVSDLTAELTDDATVEAFRAAEQRRLAEEEAARAAEEARNLQVPPERWGYWVTVGKDADSERSSDVGQAARGYAGYTGEPGTEPMLYGVSEEGRRATFPRNKPDGGLMPDEAHEYSLRMLLSFADSDWFGVPFLGGTDGRLGLRAVLPERHSDWISYPVAETFAIALDALPWSPQGKLGEQTEWTVEVPAFALCAMGAPVTLRVKHKLEAPDASIPPDCVAIAYEFSASTPPVPVQPRREVGMEMTGSGRAVYDTKQEIIVSKKQTTTLRCLTRECRNPQREWEERTREETVTLTVELANGR